MRISETQTLKRGLVITTWPASTGGGGGTLIGVDPPSVVPETCAYLIETDTIARMVTFRRIPGPRASDEQVEAMAELQRRRRGRS